MHFRTFESSFIGGRKLNQNCIGTIYSFGVLVQNGIYLTVHNLIKTNRKIPKSQDGVHEFDNISFLIEVMKMHHEQH